MAGSEKGSAPADLLQRMAQASRARVARAQSASDTTAVRNLADSVTPPPPLKLSDEGFDLIAEVKRRSPSEGALATPALSPAQQAEAYVSGGATAISVLTEPEEFGGSLEDLRAVAAAIPVSPIMRKDFLVSPYQILEARAAGASGVLLIAAILDRDVMQDMIECALGLDMFVLMEIFKREELDLCVPLLEAAGPSVDGGRCRTLIGVNCRNLRTLEVDFGRFAALAPALPISQPWVAESGVEEASQVRELTALGYRLALVGTALMRSDNPAAAVRRLSMAGR